MNSMRALSLTLSALLLVSCQAVHVQEESAQALVDPKWTVQYADAEARFIALSIVDENTVWASGTAGRFARTTDGGSNWGSALPIG